ncbi:glycosyltransferase family 2 protein [Sulfurivermis fontis]|uniref:glycosyltransferase family 2 protein n=1 Tax=Sulfurivermis fontis TaxID=1972068 RepID=UPI000FD92D04|nr:glycosyltransferase family 2 protein [Sulfurivermis fontis]
MSTFPKSVSVILPNFNGRHLLERNLPTIYQSLRVAGIEDFEILVIDDCSSDDSVNFLRSQYPDIIILQNSINQGFSSTCNKGIFAAKKQLLCVANTDVTFTDNYFAQAIPEFSYPAVFALKGDILNYRSDFSAIINTERTSLLYYRRGFLRFNQKIEPNPNDFLPEINHQFVLLGCCFVCDREKAVGLGGFDEIYSPFYWEDADLAQRAMKSGYQLIYKPECRIYHQISSTIGTYRSNTKRRLVSMRNKFLFTWRHLPTRLWPDHLAVTMLSVLTRWMILDWKYYFALGSALTRKLTYRPVNRRYPTS